MRVLHVVGSFYPARAFGGPIESNRRLCGALSGLGVRIRVLTTDTAGRARLGQPYRGWRNLDSYDVYYGRRLLRPDVSLGLLLEIRRCVRSADVVHVGGTFNWFLPFVASRCRRARVPLIVSPRGSLVAAARATKGARKRLYGALGHRRALSSVTAFHATTPFEAREIRGAVTGAAVFVVPNGVVVPDLSGPAAVSAGGWGDGPFLLYLGRLHPYKRVDAIIEAFARGVQDMPEWRLIIAGEGEPSYVAQLRSSALGYGMGPRVLFVGYETGPDKVRLLANAGALVLASSSENFGLVVAEALAHGTPCVVTRTAPWEGLEKERCGFWVDDSPEALADGMRRVMTITSEQRREMGTRGRAWMQRDFSWDSVARRMLDIYESLVEGKRKRLQDEGSRDQRVSR